MAGRPKQAQANVNALKNLNKLESPVVSVRPLIAYIMRESGCTLQEIADVFEVTRQQAENIYNKAKKELGGE